MAGCTSNEERPAVAPDTTQAAVGPPPAPSGFAVYTNDRFGFRLAYPESLLVPQGEAQNADGRQFVSEHADVTLTAFGRHRIQNDSIPALFRDRLSRRREGVVTYSAQSGDDFVISGTAGDEIYYEKTIFYGDRVARFELTYPIRRKTEMDSVAALVSRSFMRTR